uniref:PDZ domain-containing protein n=1 Tax=Callorhinchus milii TaxID=7868 RepID=A0A4W3IC26_CALMI
MPVTPENAALCLPLFERSLRSGLGEEQRSPLHHLCQSAIQMLCEYIHLNFGAVGESTFQPDQRIREDFEICPVHLTRGEGDCDQLGLRFGNVPIYWDSLSEQEKRKRETRKWGSKGPMLDIGCIWVTEVRKQGPAAKCGKIKIRDEVLSLNGQLMVGVDVAGAR